MPGKAVKVTAVPAQIVAEGVDILIAGLAIGFTVNVTGEDKMYPQELVIEHLN